MNKKILHKKEYRFETGVQDERCQVFAWGAIRHTYITIDIQNDVRFIRGLVTVYEY